MRCGISENRAVLVRDDGIGTGISIRRATITEPQASGSRKSSMSPAGSRQSIGRDLHDGLGQELTGVGV